MDDGLPLLAEKLVPATNRKGLRGDQKSGIASKPFEVQSTEEGDFNLVRIFKGN